MSDSSDKRSRPERPADSPDTDSEDVEALRKQVEEKYDFDNFGPADMAEMTAEEWDVAFDPDSWITGDELLDRVDRDLRNRVSQRDVFARIERHEDPPRVLAYSDEGYALVYPDGSVEGEGTVMRDVKPTVALASMDSYDVPETVPDNPLPEPEAVPEGGGELGNRMLQVIAGAQLLAGLGLLLGRAGGGESHRRARRQHCLPVRRRPGVHRYRARPLFHRGQRPALGYLPRRGVPRATPRYRPRGRRTAGLRP